MVWQEVKEKREWALQLGTLWGAQWLRTAPVALPPNLVSVLAMARAMFTGHWISWGLHGQELEAARAPTGELGQRVS